MRDFIFDRLFKEWRQRIEFEVYYGAGLAKKYGLADNDKRLERQFMRLKRILIWITKRIEEHPKYP